MAQRVCRTRSSSRRTVSKAPCRPRSAKRQQRSRPRTEVPRETNRPTRRRGAKSRRGAKIRPSAGRRAQAQRPSRARRQEGVKHTMAAKQRGATAVEKKLVGGADVVITAAERRKDPTLAIPVRAPSNINFNARNGMIEKGKREQAPSFFNVGMGEQFMPTV